MIRYLPLFLFPLCLTPLSSPAAELRITPENVAARVRQANPDLAAARLRIGEAAGRREQSGRLANPELSLSFQHDPRFRAGEIEVGFAQRFPLTSRLKLERNVSATLLKAAGEEVAEVERKLIAQARERMVELLLLRQRRELLKERRRLAGELADQLKAAAGRGEASALDAGQARLQAATPLIDLRNLDLQETALLGELQPLLGVLPGERLSLSGSLPAVRLPARRGETPEARPDYRAAMLQATAARQSRALEMARRVEDVEAGLFTVLERTPEQHNDGFIGLRVSLPLPLWNRNEGAIREATAREARAGLEAEALGRRIRLEAEAAYTAMEAGLATLRQLEEELIPLAVEQTRAAQQAWEAGLSSIDTLFRIHEHHQQLSLSRLDALREVHLARLRYEAALAQPQ